MNRIGDSMRKRSNVENMLHTALVLVLIALIFIMMASVEKIQGTAHLINYAGIVRGATQRLVKLELAGRDNKELEKELDDIINGLRNGGTEYQLVKIKDEVYQEKLALQIAEWDKIRKEIHFIRKYPEKPNNLLELSEEYFMLADATVQEAEDYSQRYATILKYIETALVFVIAAILFIMLKNYFYRQKMEKTNKILNQKAYIDLQTGLPNKSKCEEMLRENMVVSDTACVMFDLNNLKLINDTLGHVAGDSLIANFANILRTNIPNRYFVGRYGGDEFIATLQDVDETEVISILQNVRAGVDQFNEYGDHSNLSYAYGYAISTEYQECSLKILLEKADQNMYLNKKRIKEQEKS